MNDNEIIKAVNKEYPVNSEEDNDDKEISVDDDTIRSKDVRNMLGKHILWYEKQKEASSLNKRQVRDLFPQKEENN